MIGALAAVGEFNTYQEGELWGSLLRVLVALAVVAPLVYLVTRAYSRKAMAGGSGRALRVIDSVGLGPNKTVCLVEVADRVLVVGATPNQVSILTELTDPEVIARVRRDAVRKGSSAFAKVLKEKVDRWRESREGDKRL